MSGEQESAAITRSEAEDALDEIRGTDQRLGVEGDFGIDEVEHRGHDYGADWWVHPAIGGAPHQLGEDVILSEIVENGHDMEVLEQ